MLLEGSTKDNYLVFEEGGEWVDITKFFSSEATGIRSRDERPSSPEHGE